MDLAIIDYVKKNYGVKIGKKTAEEVKNKIGNCFGSDDTFTAVGRDEVSGLPKEISITGEDVFCAISGELKEIVNVIKATLESTPAELIYDITNQGICLSGGGAYLLGIDRFIEENIGISAHLSKNPIECAALGACTHILQGLSR